MAGTSGLQPFNLVMGPARIYTGLFDPTLANEAGFRNWNAAPPASAGWYDAGITNGDTSIMVDPKFTDLKGDQLVDNLGAKLTGRDVMITVVLAEMTLPNLALAWNSSVGATGTGYAELELYTGQGASQPLYGSVLVDGIAPTGNANTNFRRRGLLRRTLPTGKTEVVYTKDKQQGLAVQFKGFWISEQTSMLRVADQTA